MKQEKHKTGKEEKNKEGFQHMKECLLKRSIVILMSVCLALAIAATSVILYYSWYAATSLPACNVSIAIAKSEVNLRSSYCTCSGSVIRCEGVSDTTQIENELYNMQKCDATILTIEQSTFTTIPSYFLKESPFSFTHLNIGSGKLVEIEDGAFNSAPFSNLKDLLIENNPIRNLRKDSFIGFDGLSSFSLRMYSLTRVNFERNFLEHMNTINTLQIERCRLSSEAIKNITGSDVTLSALVNVALRDNLIANLEAEVFVKMYAVVLFNMDRCGIEAIDMDTFLGLINLQTLNLSNNGLTTLPEGILRNLWSLKRLDIYGNPWHCNCTICWLRNIFTTGTIIPANQPPRCRNYNDKDFSQVDFCAFCAETTESGDASEESTETKDVTQETTTTEITAPVDPGLKTIICRNWGLSPIDLPEVSSNDEMFTQEIRIAYETFTFRIYDFDQEPVALIINITSDVTNFHLLWFNTHNTNETGCMTNMSNSIILNELHRGNMYTFCALYDNQSTVSPYDCFGIQIRPEFGQRAWIRNKYSILVTTLAVILLLLAIIASALLMYCCVRKYPVLIKGNKRVVIMGKRNPEECAKPRQHNYTPPSFESAYSGHTQSNGYTRVRRRRYRSPMFRSVSEHSVFSNEVSYIRPVGPTNYQLNTWRLCGKSGQRYLDGFEETVYRPNPPPLPPPNNLRHLTWEENLYTTL